MSTEKLNQIVVRARESMEAALVSSDRVDRSVATADRVMSQLDQRDGPSRDAARRERQRLNADLGRRFARVGIAVGLISVLTIIFGLFQPIGMFGFLAAVGVAIGVAALLAFAPGGQRNPLPPSADLPNAEMVQRFDSYLYRTRRALPAPAQAEVDSLSAALPALRETLARIDTLDPNAQDARRLMSIHLPGLIDRYSRVPTAFRNAQDGEGKTVDERLVEGLSAGRAALREISENLARADVAALETQGRFITARYGQQPIDS